MSRKKSIYFDKQDRDILDIVNRGLDVRASKAQSLLDPNLHPHGIKELVDTPAARMALAVANLLKNLETDAAQARERVQGLKILYDEVMSSAQSSFRRNTARVLMQIMKSLIRERSLGGPDSEIRQLKLAHDFRRAAQGTPRIVRRLLKRYYLPEMSEQWNQLAFDDHVYDMFTKGRKTPTHLIMDAWIKGLRSLTVVYDNCVTLEAAEEVLAAAEIVGIQVRIGLEYQVPFYNRFVSMLWIPRGFSSSQDFMDFLRSPKMTALAARGREVVAWEREHTLHSLSIWNESIRPQYASRYGLTIDPLSADDFLNDVGKGHARVTRLAASIASRLRPEVDRRLAVLEEPGHVLTEQDILCQNELGKFCTDFVERFWLCPVHHPELPDCGLVPDNMDELPSLLRLNASSLVKELSAINAGYRMVLCTAGLKVEDVLELLWDCKGIISHLEIFLMRSWYDGGHEAIHEIGALQEALNSGQGPRVKQMIRQMVRRMQDEGDDERAAKFEQILRNIPVLWEHYRHVPLKSRAGTGSASRSRTLGMGLVMLDSLSPRGKKYMKKHSTQTQIVPVEAPVEAQTICHEPESPDFLDRVLRCLRFLPGCSTLGQVTTRSWDLSKDKMHVSQQGNIATLGGMYSTTGAPVEDVSSKSPGRSYLNSSLTNLLKVFIGFLPAFISFQITQKWWFLAYFGVVVWFGITGIRNVIQMVMAAKGFSRSTLVHWRDHVNVSRLCDSLMYTGFSVFLLELMCRSVILEHCLGVTVSTHPIFVFSFLGCLNGCYLFSHNIFRGFPIGAAVGNLFRWILSVPIAWLYNYLLLQAVLLSGASDPSYYIDPSATILSKMASDTIAGIIEGFVDGRQNMRIRRIDLRAKLQNIFDSYTHIEMLFPQEDALVKLCRPGGLQGRGGEAAAKLERAIIVNALDLMYIWYCKPRAQDAFRQVIRTMSVPDRTVLALSQLVLMREREVAQLMVDGLVGRDFARPLAFFLNRRREYMRQIVFMCRAHGTHQAAQRKAA